MGDPKFPRRSFDKPSHPWEGERIKEEQELVRQFGLKNKEELWKTQSTLRSLRRQSRNLQARLRYGDAQAKLETDNLLKRCGRIGLLPMEGSTLNDVLALGLESVLNRRLQTLVFRKGLAATYKQARQMIVHGHIYVDGRKVTIPGYVVTRDEEAKIEFNPNSPLSSDLHPLRVQQEEAKRAEEPQVKEPKAEAKRAKRPKKVEDTETVDIVEDKDVDIELDEEEVE